MIFLYRNNDINIIKKYKIKIYYVLIDVPQVHYDLDSVAIVVRLE